MRQRNCLRNGAVPNGQYSGKVNNPNGIVLSERNTRALGEHINVSFHIRTALH